MSQEQKELIVTLIDMVREDVAELDMPPPKAKADVIIGDLYYIMRKISSWSEGT